MAERKSTRGDIAIIVVALSVGFIFAGGGFLTAVLNTFNLEFVYPRSFSLVYFFAPVGMFVGFTTGIAFHELGHACMARILGGKVHSVQLGRGPKLAKIKWMGLSFDIHWIFDGGLVRYGILTPKWGRVKMMAVTASGIVATLLLVSTSCCPTYLLLENREAVLNHPRLLACMVGWSAGTVVLLPGILVPYWFRSAGKVFRSDVLSLLTIPFYSRETVDSFVRASQLRDKLANLQATPEGAMAMADGAPWDAKALTWSVSVLRAHKDSRSVLIGRKLLDLPSKTSQERIERLDNYLTSALDFGITAQIPDAATLADELVALTPTDPSTLGTRAAVWVDLGRGAEARPILEELSRSGEAIIQFYSNLFLAIIENRAGNLDQAKTHVRAAKQAKPDHSQVYRLTQLPTADT